MRILVAPDSFKGSLTSVQAAKVISKAIDEIHRDAVITQMPMADGGEGTVDAILLSRGGERIVCEVEDPLGRLVNACYGWAKEKKMAVIETASASGLPLLTANELNPHLASSYGTGQLIKHALDKGAETIIFGLGGSATVDAGTGIFQALGMKLFDEDGKEIRRTGGRLSQVARVDTSLLDPRLNQVNMVVASDVTNPLLGKDGALNVFGPQKGVTEGQIPEFEQGMSRFSRVIEETVNRDVKNKPGSGAAGGIGFLLHALVEAEFRSGLELMMEVSNMEKLLQETDLVLTGEGKVDGQSLFGKVPVGIARAAKRAGVPVLAFAGALGEGIDDLEREGIVTVIPITDKPMKVEEAMEQGETLLYEAAKRMMKLILLERDIKGGKENG